MIDLSLNINDISENFMGLSESIRIYNEVRDTYAYILSNHGWYLSGGMTADNVFKVLEAIKLGNIGTAESILINYYKNNLEVLKSNLEKSHTNRQPIIDEAFRAHKQRMFHSSTILFLSQADGVCEGKMFRNKKIISSFLEESKSADVLNPVIGKVSAIDVDTRKEDKSNYASDLNRHGVVHGLHTDYGTEKNSLKALSLFCFISDFIHRPH